MQAGQSTGSNSNMGSSNGAGSTMNKMAQSTSKAVQDSGSGSSFSDQASELGNKLARVKDQVMSKVSDEAHMASDFTRQAVQQVRPMLAAVESTIRSRPLISAAIAVGLGMAVVSYFSKDRRVRLH